MNDPADHRPNPQRGPDLFTSRVSVVGGLAIGLTAGFVMVFLTIVLRFASDSLSITELAADWFTSQVPGEVLDFLLETLSFSAKPLMFAGLLIAQIIIGGALGVVYARVSRRWPVDDNGEWGRILLLTAALWVLSMVLLVPMFGGGVFGRDVPRGGDGIVMASLGAFAAYGVTLALFFGGTVQRTMARRTDSGRRRFMFKMGAFAVVGVAALYGAKFVFDGIRTRVAFSGEFHIPGILSTEITPQAQFYVVSKNLVDPVVDVDQWSLQVGGMVEEPYTLTYDELLAMPSIEQFVTLECISNKVGGGLISNAKWRGVPLSHILERAKLKPGVFDISFLAWEDYSESIPLEKAMRDEVIVAYEMNGEPLTPKHGFPARLVFPGYYGLKHVKWLAGIEPVDNDFQGFWQNRGWTDTPYVETFSRFDVPRSGTTAPAGAVRLAGVAYVGNRGIANVEISEDGGQTWLSVDHISDPLSSYTWVIWTMDFTPTLRGDMVFRVRATDGEGQVQTAEERGTIPDGATGHHEISLMRTPSG
ncbi:MAG: molybdopterin-dependent oxidoreductase [Chloroflexi bacterium]|nr:molybdopterin-dependent oxidoreductase [Chloroflexota bacterium]